MEDIKLHPFERAGLGKAPFRYVGMAAQDLCYGQAILNRAEYEQTGVSVTTKPGGTCAYCGTYIVSMFNIRSGDGRVFHVGSDCVEKTGDAKLAAAVKLEKRAADKAKREARATMVKDQLTAMLADDSARAKLAQSYHEDYPSRTLLDWADWMLAHAGATGRSKTLKAVKAALETT